MEIGTREEMLAEIYNNLLGVIQWREQPWDTDCAKEVYDCGIKAETLIEFIETEDCGSVGGFDEGQKDPRNLLTRFEWICNKNHKHNKEFEKYMETLRKGV